MIRYQQQAFPSNSQYFLPSPQLQQQYIRPQVSQIYVQPSAYPVQQVQQVVRPQFHPPPPVTYAQPTFQPQYIGQRTIPTVQPQSYWAPQTIINTPPFIQKQPSAIVTQSVPLIAQSPQRSIRVEPQINNIVSPQRYSLQNGQLIPIQPYQSLPVQQVQPQQKPQDAPQKQVQQPQQKVQQSKKQPISEEEPQCKKSFFSIFQESADENNIEDAINKTKELFQPNQDAQSEELDQQQEQQPQEPAQEYQDLALQYEDGYIYRGQGFEPSTREGYGVLSDQNENEVYSGYWHDNQYHGEGKLQNFQAEQLEDPYDFSDLNNIENYWNSYEGNFNDGKMHGRGVLSFTNGERFDGTFEEGSIEGPGTYFTQDGQEIQGIWKDGILQQDYE